MMALGYRAQGIYGDGSCNGGPKAGALASFFMLLYCVLYPNQGVGVQVWGVLCNRISAFTA